MGSIFIIDELTGDIHATKRLDREEKAFYTLRAQARERLSNDLLEPESEFVIKVQDINDSEPKFLEGPYIGSVAELSPVGKARLENEAVCSEFLPYTVSSGWCSLVFEIEIGEDREYWDTLLTYPKAVNNGLYWMEDFPHNI